MQQILSYGKVPLQSFVQNYDAPTGPIYQNINHYKYQDEGLSAQSFEKFNTTSEDSDDDDDDVVKKNGSFSPYGGCSKTINFLMISWILYEYGLMTI